MESGYIDSAEIARAVSALSDGVVLTDPWLPDHPIVWANDAFCELTGYRRDEVVGRNCRFLQGPLTDVGTVARIRAAVAAREHFHEALLNYRKDGTAFWNALTVSPVFDAAGGLVNFVAAQSDISLVKRLEAEFRHAEKIELVGRMAGGIAHDSTTSSPRSTVTWRCSSWSWTRSRRGATSWSCSELLIARSCWPTG